VPAVVAGLKAAAAVVVVDLKELLVG